MRPHCLLASLALLAMGSCVHGRASLSDGGAGGQGGSTGGDGGQVASVGGGGAGGMGGAGGAEGGGGNEPGCGDGVLDPVDEQCDDGNQISQDGCDPSCNVECAAGWFDAATNHCYRMIASSATWHDARDGCTSLSPGYDLAALSSDAELTFVVGQLSAALRFWIGGNDLQTEGTFTWSNGEDWSYTAWGLDEPNDTTPGEDCVEMRQLNAEWVWNDLPCTSTTPTAFLCELTPAGSP